MARFERGNSSQSWDAGREQGVLIDASVSCVGKDMDSPGMSGISGITWKQLEELSPPSPVAPLPTGMALHSHSSGLINPGLTPRGATCSWAVPRKAKPDIPAGRGILTEGKTLLGCSGPLLGDFQAGVRNWSLSCCWLVVSWSKARHEAPRFDLFGDLQSEEKMNSNVLLSLC